MKAIDVERTQRFLVFFFQSFGSQPQFACPLGLFLEKVEDAVMPEVQNLRPVKPAVLATKDR